MIDIKPPPFEPRLSAKSTTSYHSIKPAVFLGLKGDSSNVDQALTRTGAAYTQVKCSGFKPLIYLEDLVAGTRFELVTFRL